MKQNRDLQGKGALEIIEEAVHLLRMSPAGILASYYIGSLPFILGLLLFWADMTRSAFAYKYCAAASLGLAILFVWMKCWQGVFAYQLRARLCGEPAPRWTLRRIGRLATVQTMIQPSGFFTLPVALIMALPLGWVYAFYQNVSAQGDGEDNGVKKVLRRSWQQARLWPKQNHILLAILFLFGLFVFINLAISVSSLPRLLKGLLGIETVFTRSGWSMLNTTFFAIICGFAYLCMDPLLKTVYVLRCFYGSSLQTGEDLKAQLKTLLRSKAVLATLMIFLGLSTAMTTSVMAREDTMVPLSDHETLKTGVSPGELDRSIEKVMSRREYTWRIPRERISKEDREKMGLFAVFLEWVARTVRSMTRTIGQWIEKLLDWLATFLPKAEEGRKPSETDWMTSVRGLVFVLLGLVVCGLAVVFWRAWRRRGKARVVVASEAIPSTPDLTDDQLKADDLPVDRWLSLAREMMEKGELQLALRALYLASLAHLAEHELITIARYKSNREYELELRRKAHDQGDLVTVFSKNVVMFDRTWYGMHYVTHEEMRRFTENHERIMVCHEA